MAAHTALIRALRQDFARNADAGRAAAMRAYMKSALPFHGIATPLRRRLTADALKAHPVADAAALHDTMLALWREAAHREERYAASELARARPHRAWLELPLLPVFTEMIESGAWWDHCDEISGEAVAPLLVRHPRLMKPLLRRWAQGDDLWLRRAAIVCQRGLGLACDARLLYDCILPSIGSPARNPWAREFFLRKGIGWALRQRACAAPDEVQAFCREHAAGLAPLTLREALRRISGGGAAGAADSELERFSAGPEGRVKAIPI
jgi:3-methyladenine DNA glycosylase AlkD